jgi:hypothetical protein
MSSVNHPALVIDRLRRALEAAATELMNQQDAWDEMLEHATTEGRKTACLRNGCAAYGARQRIRALLDGRAEDLRLPARSREQQLEEALRGLLGHIAVIYPPGSKYAGDRHIEWHHPALPGEDLYHYDQAAAALWRDPAEKEGAG